MNSKNQILKIIDYFCNTKARCIVTGDLVWGVPSVYEHVFVPTINVVHDGMMFAIPFSEDGYRKVLTEIKSESQVGRTSVSNTIKVINDYLMNAFGIQIDGVCSKCKSGQAYYIVETNESFHKQIFAVRSTVNGIMTLTKASISSEISPSLWSLYGVRLAGAYDNRSYDNYCNVAYEMQQRDSAMHQWPNITDQLFLDYYRYLVSYGVIQGACYEYGSMMSSCKVANNSFKTLLLDERAKNYFTSIQGYKLGCEVMMSMHIMCSRCFNADLRAGDIISVDSCGCLSDEPEHTGTEDSIVDICSNALARCRQNTHGCYNQRVQFGNIMLSHIIQGSSLALALVLSAVSAWRNTRRNANLCRICGVVLRGNVDTQPFYGRILFPEYGREPIKMDAKKGIITPQDGDWICSECFNRNYVRCQACTKWTHKDLMYSKPMDIGKRGKKDIMMCSCCHSVHTHRHPKDGILFGSEIEVASRTSCYNTSEFWDKIIANVPRKQRSKLTWTRDGSLTGHNPLEIITRPCKKDEYEELVEALSIGLDAADAVVNTSCGFHIHIGGDLTWMDAALLFEFCKRNEELFFNMYSERRGNQFCQSLSVLPIGVLIDGWKFPRLDKQTFLNTLFRSTHPTSKSLYTAYGMLDKYRPLNGFSGDRETARNARYCWANFYSYLYRKTVEIRIASGTTDAGLLGGWVDLWEAIVLGLRRHGRQFTERVHNTTDIMDIYDLAA